MEGVVFTQPAQVHFPASGPFAACLPPLSVPQHPLLSVKATRAPKRVESKKDHAECDPGHVTVKEGLCTPGFEQQKY